MNKVNISLSPKGSQEWSIEKRYLHVTTISREIPSVCSSSNGIFSNLVINGLSESTLWLFLHLGQSSARQYYVSMLKLLQLKSPGAFLQEAQSLFFISELLAHIMKSVKLKGISKP